MTESNERIDVSQALEAPELGMLREDPVAQWLDWEEQANLLGFRMSTEPVEIQVCEVPKDRLEIFVLPSAPESLVSRFVGESSVRFPRHPLNRDRGVAWFDAPVVDRWLGRFTASRTLALPGPDAGDRLCSLKLPTDHPHPNLSQPEKTRLREEALDAVRWVHTLERIDRMLPPPHTARMVLEALVVMTRDSETGFLVRDLEQFQDGHYYLPALSLPWVGPAIAARYGVAFEVFWREHFARAVGRGKAELLARYGLWYKTPNPQNVVVQLDPGLMPTGRLIFRDLGDGEAATDAFEASDAPWTRLVGELRLETENSFWAFGEAEDRSVARDVLESWYSAHDDAYFGELARVFDELAPAHPIAPDDRAEHWQRTLSQPGSRASIARSFHRLRESDR